MGASRELHGKRRRWRVTLLTAVSLLSIASSALAQGWDPQTEPETNGPLFANGDASCGGGEAKTPQGEVAAESSACVWWFEYLPALETDLQRDHGVLWLQTTFTPRDGFCLVGVTVHLGADPESFRIESWMPDEGRGRTRPGVADFSMTTDAGGNGLQEASVLATAVPQQRGTSRTVAPGKNGVLEYRWTAARPTTEQVNAVVAVEVSWSADLPGSLLRLYGLGIGLRSTVTEC